MYMRSYVESEAVPVGDYVVEYEQLLGKGTTGTVYKGTLVAIQAIMLLRASLLR